jgi:zinc and cadmium transporter
VSGAVTVAVCVDVAIAIVLDGGAALVAGVIPERWLDRARVPLLGFTAGVLLATCFLDIIPEATAQIGVTSTLAAVLCSMFLMVVLEWSVGHRGARGGNARRLAAVLLGADAFHNTADGAAIAAAFLSSTRLGVITAAAVIVHEVPEEVADYVLLRRAGMPRGRAIVAMAGVQLTAAIGAVAVLVGASAWRHASGFALAIAAGTFLHIAEVDLVPTVVEPGASRRSRAEALVGLLAGAAVVLAQLS